MNSQINLQADIRDNKVKQGMLIKQSRHMKQWKQRWVVLTKSFIYTFASKGVYKNPTEMISLKEVETLKSYYKDQYKPYTFRVEKKDIDFHMCAKSADQKLAWMTAIEKMIDRAIHPQPKMDIQSKIRQTIKMASSVRQTFLFQQQKKENQLDISEGLFKKLKLKQQSIYSQTIFPQSKQPVNFLTEQQQTFFILNKPQSKDSPKKTTEFAQSHNYHNSQIVAKTQDKIVERIVQVQKIVQVPTQKIVQVPVDKIVQKVVYVPQIKQVIVEKIVYKQKQVQKQNGNLKQPENNLAKTLKTLMLNPGQNPSPLVNFVVYILTVGGEQHKRSALQFCLDNQSRRFFAQIFLLLLNEQTNEETLNQYLSFTMVLLQNSEQYFYKSDTQALISILIRQMQMNRSQYQQFLIMSVVQTMVSKSWWRQLNYRKVELANIIKQVASISRQENQFLAQSILAKI